MAADDIASLLCEVALGQPIHGTIEIGGPERSHLDEVVRTGLAASKDPREVVADPHGRYYGMEMKERTLVPDDNAKLGKIRFEDWLAQPGVKAVAGAH